MLFIVVLLAIVNNCEIVGGDDEKPIGAEKDMDYTMLAREAEMHKHDILNFLNQSHVKEQYRTLYKCLLSKLIEGKQAYYWLCLQHATRLVKDSKKQIKTYEHSFVIRSRCL